MHKNRCIDNANDVHVSYILYNIKQNNFWIWITFIRCHVTEILAIILYYIICMYSFIIVYLIIGIDYGGTSGDDHGNSSGNNMVVMGMGIQGWRYAGGGRVREVPK